MTAPIVIVVLQVAVVAVTVLFAASMVAVALGHRRLHGRLNTAFFALTMAAVLGLEVVVRVVWPELSAEFFDPAGPYRRPLLTHLMFSVPAALALAVMMYTGRFGRGRAHRALSMVFVVLWIGTVVTGVFYLPSSAPGTHMAAR
jgi:uncharacterized membrane protein YozB (DUF420 family)